MACRIAHTVPSSRARRAAIVRRAFLGAVAAALTGGLGSLPAQAEILRYDISIRSLRVGQLVVSGQDSSGGYAVEGRMRAAGLIGAFVSADYDASAQGILSGRGLIPRRAELVDGMGRNRGSVILNWRGDVPLVAAASPERPPLPWDIEAADQAGAVDPLSALWEIGRAQPIDGLCNRVIAIFDGYRASRLTLANPVRQADGRISCSGEWRRLAGYAPEDLAEGVRQGFTLSYLPDQEGLARLTRMRAGTRYGPADLVRR